MKKASLENKALCLFMLVTASLDQPRGLWCYYGSLGRCSQGPEVTCGQEAEIATAGTQDPQILGPVGRVTQVRVDIQAQSLCISL